MRTLKEIINYYENIPNPNNYDKQLKNWLKELQRFRTIQINEEISNPFANVSSLGCVHCDHKDEYIIDLEKENDELKQEVSMLEEKIEKIKEVLEMMKKLP